MLTRMCFASVVVVASSQAVGQWQVNPANGHSYALTPTPGSFADARAYAASVGGYVVAINDAAENLWLTTTFGGSSSFYFIRTRLQSATSISRCGI